MSRFHWISKDVHEDRDITSDSKLSTVTVRSSPEVIYSGEWTTSRRELGYFYLYSIVRFSLFALSFPIFYYRPEVNKSLAGFRFGPSQIQKD